MVLFALSTRQPDWSCCGLSAVPYVSQAALRDTMATSVSISPSPSLSLALSFSLFPPSLHLCMCLQGVENAVGVLRNLSYQLYSEIPPSTLLRLEGPTRARATTETESIGCFTPQSKKAKEVGVSYTRQNQRKYQIMAKHQDTETCTVCRHTFLMDVGP